MGVYLAGHAEVGHLGLYNGDGVLERLTEDEAEDTLRVVRDQREVIHKPETEEITIVMSCIFWVFILGRVELIKKAHSLRLT